MEYVWKQKPKIAQAAIDKLSKDINVNATLANMLINRGVENFDQAKDYFRPSLNLLHDPFLMKGMETAILRINKAVINNEKVLIFGDYDVDGTTAVALVYSFFKSYLKDLRYYIPDRNTEGYGISFKSIDYAKENNFSLIIALDCGIKANDKIDYATNKNIDFIICDHHLPGDEIPKAIAVLDPKRGDCSYPYDELCGCGVGFKLIQALAQNRNQTIDDLLIYLDLVATAIAADIVPITGENRVLAKFGLEVINTNPRPGIKALIQNLKKKVLTITDVVFIIAPRINAAGRIKHGNEAVALLTEYDLDQAEIFASEIEQHNSDRKDLDKQITVEALSQIEENNETNRFTTVVYQENWHKGVIGIVASRLTETYYRPTIVFTKSGDKLAASARSVKDFDVYNALEACAEHLEQFGGHMYAAGMTLKEENYTAFKEAFERVVEQTIHPDLLIPEISADVEMELSDINEKLIRLLNQFEPFGPQNMTPVFLTKGVKDTGYAKGIGQNEEHLKLFVKQSRSFGSSEGFGAIGFGLGNKLELTKNQNPFDMAFCIDENEFNGNVTVQLRLKDLR
jgi:single-stranded-DNA-specific exonuclease